MSPQSEGRPSTDARPADRTADSGYASQWPPQHNPNENNSSTYLPARGNGYDTSDIPQQIFMGAAAENEQMSNGGLPASPVDGRNAREREQTKNLSIRERSRGNGSAGRKNSTGTLRLCRKCDEPLTGQFVRALAGTFHLECFKCQDCGQVVASKFFPVDDEDGIGQYPLCETDYFRRLDLLCFECGGALRGSYITALERKYHIEHFTCSVCPTIFGAQDSYYEHEGKVYCHYHYSTQFAQRCNGCQTAILKQFVEIFRNGQNQHWHPECYMIHKFWNVRLASSNSDVAEKSPPDEDATEEKRIMVREEEEQMEEKVYRIWSVLSTFEESSAACISDMLLHVSNGAYVDGVMVAKKFIWHVDVLFSATDKLDYLMTSEGMKVLAYGREAKLLCKKIVAFFSLLTKTQETGVRKLGVTQELLSLVTGLAHYLKLLIRISLQGALRLERERRNTDGLHRFLDELGDLESIKEAEKSLESTTGVSRLADQRSDLCDACKEPIDDECARLGERRWHRKHLNCETCLITLGEDLGDAMWSPKDQRTLCRRCVEENYQSPDAIDGFEHTTRLQQYVYLLRVALARLLSVLRSGGTLPHTSDDPNLTSYDSNEGHRISPSGQLDPPMLRSNTRSKSHGDTAADEKNGSSYEQTVGEMKRLRSTRMDKHLSTTIKKARTSRIIDGPEGRSIRPGSAGADGSDMRTHGFHIIEDRDANGEARTDLTFGNHDALTLDDIPRIVAAEQAKEQRPNAYKHAKNQLIGSGGRQPKLYSGHQRDVSGGDELDRHAAGDTLPQRPKRYFSELSALEYFIVRHVAVLSMEPLLEGHYNLEDLLGLIESRKPTNFWGKFGKAFKNDRARTGKKKGVFGVSLDMLVERDGVESTYGVGPGALRVPGLLDDSISAMRRMDMSVEGVFRKNGNIRGLKELQDRIDAKAEDVDLTREHPVQVAALLKRFLRQLPDPLLTFKLHRLFITSQKITDEQKRRRVLHLTCCLLPKTHRDSLEILFSFLNWASSFSQVDEETGSKMDTHNLATVITPNILYPNSKNIGMDESFLAIEAVHSLIDYNDQMCEASLITDPSHPTLSDQPNQVPEDLQSILNDSSLFNNSSDITTKEILKRYGDIGKPTGAQHTTVVTNPSQSTPPRSKEGGNGSTRTGAPVVTQVDNDPYQANARQKESSVRHVQASGAAAPIYPPSTGQHTNPPPYKTAITATQDTPPQAAFEFATAHPPSPYHHRTVSADTQGSNGAPRQHAYRRSDWGKQGLPPGPMGVTGAG